MVSSALLQVIHNSHQKLTSHK